MAEFKKAQRIVASNEGGYQADPSDNGNYTSGKLIGTKYGISAPVLASYLGRVPTVMEMRGLTKSVAEDILKTRYWLANNLDKIKNQSVANLIYDGVVNQGASTLRVIVSNASAAMKSRIAQHLVFTPSGIDKVNKLNQLKLFLEVKRGRTQLYKKTKGADKYLDGWLSRMNKITFSGDLSAFRLMAAALCALVGIGILMTV